MLRVQVQKPAGLDSVIQKTKLLSFIMTKTR